MNMRQECGLPEDAEILDCDGVRLAVKREGQGWPLVCLHAVAHGGRDFEKLSATLGNCFQVIRIDWPDHGRSGPDSQPPSARRYAEILEIALQKLQVTQPIILGNSIGGGAAIHYAARQPVRALVLCDSAGLVPVNAMVRGIVSLFVRFFRAGEGGAGWFGSAYRFYYRHMVLPQAAAAEQRQRIIDAGYEYAPLLRAAWEGFGQPEADIREMAAGLDMPVWCAWAKGDRVIPLWMCKPAIKALRQGSLSTFKGGHSAFMEQPDAFLQGFMAFCEGLPSAPTVAAKKEVRHAVS